jgi:uncharacterized protein (TIGR02001 family)
MTKHIASVIALTLGLVLTASAADYSSLYVDIEEEETMQANIMLDLVSSYVWRGQIVNKEPCLQPAFGLETPCGFGVSAWANLDLTDKNDHGGDFTEIDLTAGYAVPLEGMIGLEFGLVAYTFPATSDKATYELFALCSFDCFLAPAIEFYYDFDQAEGFYCNVNINHGWEINEAFVVDAAMGIGFASDKYNTYYFGDDTIDDAFNDLNLSCTAAYDLTDNLTVGAGVAFSQLLDTKIRDAVKDESQFYGGLSLEYVF